MAIDIDRTIEKLKLVVEKMKVVGDSNYWTMEEHKQIADWLEELKAYKKNSDICPMCDTYCFYLVDEFENGYNKAIDHFVREFKRKTPMENSLIDELAEQLKEGGTDDY